MEVKTMINELYKEEISFLVEHSDKNLPEVLRMFMEMKISKSSLNDHTHYPEKLDPVLAKIEHINSLGKSSWWEVVYYDGRWRSYSGSKTFEDGEKVVKWRYCVYCV